MPGPVKLILFILEVVYLVFIIKYYMKMQKFNRSRKIEKQKRYLNLFGVILILTILQISYYTLLSARFGAFSIDYIIYPISIIISIQMIIQSRKIKVDINRVVNIEEEENTLDSKIRKTARLSIVTGIILLIWVVIGLVTEFTTYTLEKKVFYLQIQGYIDVLKFNNDVKTLLIQSIPAIIISFVSIVFWRTLYKSHKTLNQSMNSIGYKNFFSYAKLIFYGSLGYLIMALIFWALLAIEKGFIRINVYDVKFNDDTYDIMSIIMGTYFIFIFVCAILLIVSGYNLTRYYGQDVNNKDVQ
jgi:hypothetical protein